MSKAKAYMKLVEKRKACHQCSNCGLVNPSLLEGGKFDSVEIGPWTRWQNDLNADIMVIGQDWGSEMEFKRMNGVDSEKNATNTFLIELMAQLNLNIQVGKPKDGLFFTNAALCIRKKGAQGGLNEEWLFNCRTFFKEQIAIVQPRRIVCLGQKTYYAALSALDLPRKWNLKYADQVGSATTYKNQTLIFPVYHPSAYGRMTRSREIQLQDWKNISEWK